jgi:SAM-dependent methyltransferase
MGTRTEQSSSVHQPTVDGFGFEWTEYDQGDRDPASLERSFERYFARFPWDDLAPGHLALDVGCGSGRWAAQVARRGFEVVAVDASPAALRVATRVAPLAQVVQGSAVELPLRDASVDFAFSLGVLHHLPDTAGALREVHRVLRPGAPFLVYLYYAFDNRPRWFRLLWRVSDVLRRGIARMPERARLALTRAIALGIYWPFARASRALARRGRDVARIPLSSYRDQPLYVMRTDALDRFGTRLEKRYTKAEIRSMLQVAGFRDVEFNPEWPHWCAVARA